MTKERATRTSDTTKPEAKKHAQQHGLVDATTLSGAIAGAATGALGGPPGVIVGGAIGTAIGLLAGTVLEREATQADEHDKELDDAIGVESGSLGAREQAAAALTALEAKRAREEALEEAALERALDETEGGRRDG